MLASHLNQQFLQNAVAIRKLVTEKKVEMGSGLSPHVPVAVRPRPGPGRPRRHPERLSASIAKLDFSDVIKPLAPAEVCQALFQCCLELMYGLEFLL